VSAPDLRSITLITYPSVGNEVIQALHRGGINTASFHRARGSSIGDPVARGGVPVQHEQDVVTVVVSSEIADEIFQFLFQLFGSKEDRPGFLYMAKLSRSSDFKLPKI